MTTPDIATGGDLGFSYELQIDIDRDYYRQNPTGVPDWVQLGFIKNVQPGNDKNMADSATYKNRGAAAQAITGESWQLTFDHQVQRQDNGLYIDTLQALVDSAGFGRRNKGAKQHVRFYDTEGADYAWEGEAYVAMSRTNTGNNDIADLSFTLTGDGELTKITNPFAQPLPVDPEITSVSPSGQGTGDLVTIKGHRFTGATAVTFDSIAATQFAVSDDNTIVAELPSDDAGAVDVEVTTPGGTSDPLSYTRAA